MLCKWICWYENWNFIERFFILYIFMQTFFIWKMNSLSWSLNFFPFTHWSSATYIHLMHIIKSFDFDFTSAWNIFPFSVFVFMHFRLIDCRTMQPHVRLPFGGTKLGGRETKRWKSSNLIWMKRFLWIPLWERSFAIHNELLVVVLVADSVCGLKGIILLQRLQLIFNLKWNHFPFSRKKRQPNSQWAFIHFPSRKKTLNKFHRHFHRNY